MTKDIKAKINEFTKLIKQYPHVQELYVHRAILYEKSKQYQKAVEDYKMISPVYYINFDMAGICERNGLNKEAEEFYTKAINEDKKNIQNYISRIYFYMRIREIEKAIIDCQTVLKLSPKNETALTLKKILTGKLD